MAGENGGMNDGKMCRVHDFFLCFSLSFVHYHPYISISQSPALLDVVLVAGLESCCLLPWFLWTHWPCDVAENRPKKHGYDWFLREKKILF